jgi:hypothetical protein
LKPINRVGTRRASKSCKAGSGAQLPLLNRGFGGDRQDGGIFFIARDHIGGETLKYAEPHAPYPELADDAK